jgi:hypothetical protein
MPRSAPIAAAGVLCLLIAPPAGAVSKRAAAPRERGAAERTLSEATRLAQGRGVRTGRELTHVLRDLAIRLPALPRGDRREARRLLARPDDSAGSGEFTWSGDDAIGSPHCTASFCVHWPLLPTDAPDLDPASTDGDLIPDYVETMATELQSSVRQKEVTDLGWQSPPSDGDGKTDVYIVDFGDSGIFGVTAIDPGQSGSSRSAYLLLDDDYGQDDYGSSETPLDFMRATAAHEYNHVLQFGYDVFQDIWMAEATAVWMEDKVYPAIDDYLRFLDDWARLTAVPLTYFNTTDDDDPLNVKAYGSAVWNRWLESRYGPQLVRDAWEGSILTDPGSFGPAAYDLAIRAAGGRGFFDEFVRFAAASAEWRATRLGISEASWTGVPDVTRLETLPPDRGFVQGQFDHTSYAVVSVPATTRPIKLIGTAPSGDDAAFALVTRTGTAAGGTVGTQLSELPNGGLAVTTLTSTSGLQRISAVLVNADAEPVTFDGDDWVYARDDQMFRAFVSTDFAPPGLADRSPDPGATRVSTRARPSATFSEPVSRVSDTTFRLTGPDGATVPASVSYDAGSRRARLRPTDELSDTTRYTARLESGILDAGANPFPPTTWTFRTVKRPPRFRLSIRSRQRRSTVLRRGVLVTLRSRDHDALRFAVLAAATRQQLATGSRTVGRKRGSVRAGKKVRLRVRLKRAAKRAVRRGPVRLRLKVTLRDPQGNARRVKKRVVIR